MKNHEMKTVNFCIEELLCDERIDLAMCLNKTTLAFDVFSKDEGEPVDCMRLPSTEELYPLNEARMDYYGGYTSRKERANMGKAYDFYEHRNRCAAERLLDWLEERGYVLDVNGCITPIAGID